MMEDLHYLRLDGTVFFGHEMTYMLLAKDIVYVLSFIVLLSSIINTGNCRGVSLKTHVVYILAFSSRLYDFYPFHHWNYDVISTFLFIALSAFLLFFAVCILNSFFENGVDPWWVNPLMYSTMVLAVLFNYSHLDTTLQIVLFAWNHYLEAVAIIPQLWVLAKRPQVFGATSGKSSSLYLYVHGQAIYRILDILHWVYLYLDVDLLDHLAVISDGFHLSVYCSFIIYTYFGRRGQKKLVPKQDPATECPIFFEDIDQPKFTVCDKKIKYLLHREWYKL